MLGFRRAATLPKKEGGRGRPRGEAREGGIAVTGIALMQLGGNGGAKRRRFPRVAFEGGLSEPTYSESLLRLAGHASSCRQEVPGGQPRAGC
jgi:hypothetical protein